MERLHQLTLLTGALACLLFAVPSSGAQDYCSLRVRVLAPNGQRPEAPVSVIETNGRTEEKAQDTSKDVQFCDLGILPVTVVVGQKGCDQVVVKDVPLSWQEPYTLLVTYDVQKCTQDHLPPPKPVCQVLLRIAGSDGKWIRKAAVTLSEPALPQLQTDSAGRAFLLVGLDDRVRGSVGAPGYATKEFSFGCSGFPGHEEILHLTK